ncbi:MAG: phosphatidylinositol kinase [bacterium]|nr:phosphatidylinositol kinase [bacterium]
MKKAKVFTNHILAGILEEGRNEYIFTYDEEYLKNESSKAVSLTLPKRPEPYRSPHLFSFFYGLLAEGVTKKIQCRKLRIDENDHFTRLIKTAGYDTIGSVTVEEIK